MADKKWSELPAAQAGSEADFTAVVQSGESRRQTRTQLRTAILSSWTNFIRTFLGSSTTAQAREAIEAAAVASPAFSGVPTAPTAAAGTSSTQVATTAFVTAADNLKAPLASPTFTGVPTAPTPTLGDNTTKLATMAAIRTAMLGTVADTAGLPTGSAIEYTTGADGACLRFADGTQLTSKTIAIGSVGFSASGSVFISSTAQGGGGYTKNFVGVPQGFVTVRGASGLVWHTINSLATATAWPTFYIMSSTNTTTAVTADLLCFGRWK